MVEFNIVESTLNEDMEEAIRQDYLNGLRGTGLMQKHNIGRSRYCRLLKEFREEGIPVQKGYNVKPKRSKPKYYKKCRVIRSCKTYYTYWEVRRMFNRKLYRFGVYKTEQEAQAKVAELEVNNWEGLLV